MSRDGPGPVDRMGKILCSLNSFTDFPPLDQYTDENRVTRFTRLSQWEESNNTEELIEDSSTNSEGDSGSQNSSIFMNISFQEALSREKAPDKRKNNVLNLVTLRKTQIIRGTDSRQVNHTLSKKVSDEDSGWWKITGKNIMQEDLKI